MSNAIAFQEQLISQIPAVQVLVNLGYTYLPPAEALRLRGGKYRHVLLETVLLDWLRTHNRITFKGHSLAFSEANLQQAVRLLKEEPYDGLVRTNAKVYELLTLGASLPQTVGSDTRSFDLRYIDWQHPENNVYHVSDEFVVEKRRSEETRRPDIVLFVNGIPLVVIECKRPDLHAEGQKAVQQAVSQHLRNQKDDEIPHLYVFSQLLLALSKNDALYATTHSAMPYWAAWREEHEDEAALLRLINTPLSEAQKRLLYARRSDEVAVMSYFEDLEQAGPRLPTAQDRCLHNLLRPVRLLELLYQFIVFDSGDKKIARYQQYFTVKETLQRVAHLDAGGTRAGGVIWHTTGSGKSLTMVMLAKALTLHPNVRNPRVIIVTDRVDLDRQIWGTFTSCGKRVEQAHTGRQLLDLVRQGQADLITTVINKFETLAKEKLVDSNPNIFVLVDEGHRTQYGSLHAAMRLVFPHACYIGFTGTPLLKDEKSTVAKFGGMIQPSYSMRRAVEDGAVVPLLYEGRLVELNVNQGAIDTWFERVTADLNDEQRADLKRKFSRAEAVNQSEQRIAQIAYDLSQHYRRTLQGTGLKAQLATGSKLIALKYKQHLDEFGLLSSEVVISAPDTREGNEEVDNTRDPALEGFWKRVLERFGSEERYNRELIEQFHQSDGFELLIVVDKLLVGFDEPRNTVLYIDKSLKEHAVLQAIARVNRLFEAKDFGYVIDYYGVLGELNDAMHTYDALDGFDPEDVAGAITDMAEEAGKLPQRHSDLWDVFKTVANKLDEEAFEVFLEPEDRRAQFYSALSDYARALQVALSMAAFYTATPEARIQRYKDDLKFFHNLRMSVKKRYAETIDYKDYEKKIRKLLDSHIQAGDVTPITELVNIFDQERFAQEVERIEGTAAQADTIAHRLQRTISERMQQDPVFYKRFSSMIAETIRAYKEGRINDLVYLEQMHAALQAVQNQADEAAPPQLRHSKHATAYYGVLRESAAPYFTQGDPPDLTEMGAAIALRVEQIIDAHKIRDWVRNRDIQQQMKAALEDYLLDEIQPRYGVKLDTQLLDEVLERWVEVARRRDAL